MNRHAIVPALLGAGILLVPALASAQNFDAPAPTNPRDRARDPYLMIEFRLGPYHPNVDDGVGPAHDILNPNQTKSYGPYHQIFGDSKRFLFSAHVEWEFYQVPHFGSLGVGGTIGYTSIGGKALRVDNGQPSDEDTTLTIFPMLALVVARANVLYHDLGIPVVPYVKVGPGVAFWSAANGSGTSRAKSDNTEGRGHTFGYAYALGVSFVLDALDSQAAKTFSVEQGVQHSYLFAEYTATVLEGLGQKGAMYVGDKTWNLGFAFEL